LAITVIAQMKADSFILYSNISLLV